MSLDGVMAVILPYFKEFAKYGATALWLKLDSAVCYRPRNLFSAITEKLCIKDGTSTHQRKFDFCNVAWSSKQ